MFAHAVNSRKAPSHKSPSRKRNQKLSIIELALSSQYLKDKICPRRRNRVVHTSGQVPVKSTAQTPTNNFHLDWNNPVSDKHLVARFARSGPRCCAVLIWIPDREVKLVSLRANTYPQI
ncbi:hypothetical protein HCH54_008802 [Aspergillus fumigatus]